MAKVQLHLWVGEKEPFQKTVGKASAWVRGVMWEGGGRVGPLEVFFGENPWSLLLFSVLRLEVRQPELPITVTLLVPERNQEFGLLCRDLEVHVLQEVDTVLC